MSSRSLPIGRSSSARGAREPAPQFRRQQQQQQQQQPLQQSSSSTTQQQQQLENVWRRIPKDRGWAWMCVLGAFLMNMLVVGAAQKSFGVLFVEFMERFDASAGAAAWIAALSQCLTLVLGPMANMLSMRYTSRKVVFTGGLIVCCGFLLSMFASSLEYLYISYGLLVGIGSAMAYSPSIVTVGQYFEKHRALANGISVSGSGLGNFAIPPLMRVLLDNYGLRGTMLILSGLMLNVCVCGALLRPLDFYTKIHLRRLERQRAAQQDSSESEASDDQKDSKDGPKKQPKKKKGKKNGDDSSDDDDGNAAPVMLQKMIMRHQIKNFKEQQAKAKAKAKRLKKNKKKQLPGERERKFSQSSTAALEIKGEVNAKNADIMFVAMPLRAVAMMPLRAMAGDMAIATAQHSAGNSELHKSQGSRNSNSQCGNRHQQGCCPWWCPVFEWQLLLNPLFLLFVLSAFFGYCGYPNLFIIVPANAEELNLTKSQGALLLSVMGASDVVGRILFGWFSDLNMLAKRRIYSGSLAIAGAICCMCTIMRRFTGLVILNGAIGLFAGSFIALIPVLLAENLGAQRLPSAFGLTVMFMGISFVIAAPLVGLLRDVTGTWIASYYFCGGSMLLGAVFVQAEHKLTLWLKARRVKRVLRRQEEERNRFRV